MQCNAMMESCYYEHQWKVEYTIESRLSFDLHVGRWLTFSNIMRPYQSFKADFSRLQEEWL